MKVFLFPLNNALTLPKVAIPLHIFEPRYREMIQDATTREVPVAVVQVRPDNDYRGVVFAAGVPQVMHRHEDGRLDISIIGEFRGRTQDRLGVSPYISYSATEDQSNAQVTQKSAFARECLKDSLMNWAASQMANDAQIEALNELLQDPEALASYSSMLFVQRPFLRQQLLEEGSVEKRLLAIWKEIMPPEILLGPFLRSIRVNS